MITLSWYSIIHFIQLTLTLASKLLFWQLSLFGLRNNDTARSILPSHSLNIGVSDSGISYPYPVMKLLWYSTTYFIYLTFPIASYFNKSSFQPSLSLSLLVNTLGHFIFISMTLSDMDASDQHNCYHLLVQTTSYQVFINAYFNNMYKYFSSFSASSRQSHLQNQSISSSLSRYDSILCTTTPMTPNPHCYLFSYSVYLQCIFILSTTNWKLPLIIQQMMLLFSY